MKLRITQGGYILIKKGDDLLELAHILSASPDAGEFCVTDCLESAFAAELCAAGFLVMSYRLESGETLLFPKYHKIRSALFFDKLHISKSVKKFLPHYQLKFDDAFDIVVKNCVKFHGDDWLTDKLLEIINEIKNTKNSPVRPVSFALYRGGELKAGEFGVISGRVYTSYSGYYAESSAGRVQMIKTAQFLEQNGFSFWDLGMPLPYKNTLGALDIDAVEWTRLFINGAYNTRGA